MVTTLDELAGLDVPTIDAIGALVVAVSDPAEARKFYSSVLGGDAVGTDILPECGAHEVIRFPSGQFLIAAQTEDSVDLSETGVHQAYRATPAALETILSRLAMQGVDVHDYREDREVEQDDRVYFSDPFGNRVQIVTRHGAAGTDDGVFGIDHAAVQLPDMLWGEHFYGTLLGLPAESRFGVKTADHARARIWAKGGDDMAPGTRRLDKLYMTMGGQNEVPRTNMQVYYTAGDGVIGVYLATAHFQEPPEEQLVGVPRINLAAPRASLDAVAARLERADRPCLGPVAHPASAPYSSSLYFKDTGGNFIEISSPGGS